MNRLSALSNWMYVAARIFQALQRQPVKVQRVLPRRNSAGADAIVKNRDFSGGAESCIDRDPPGVPILPERTHGNIASGAIEGGNWAGQVVACAFDPKHDRLKARLRI